MWDMESAALRRTDGSDGKDAVLIAGPTASGKSALASALAERLGGVVINADSMQVYRELRIITARPDAGEEARAPHRLYGHVPAAQAYSTGRWLADAAGAVETARRAGRPAILVGGTGLYFSALTRGLSAIPPVPEAVRAPWRARLEEEGACALHRVLGERDPDMAGRLNPSDGQRISRALEVLEATGRSLLQWQSARGVPLLPEARRLVLDLDRACLAERIAARARIMLETGAVDEVRALLALGLDPRLPAMKALGVGEIADHLADRTDFEETLTRITARTRRYAKRQETWFRHQFADWPRLDAEQAGEAGRALAALGISA